MKNKIAPIGISAYKRLEHLRACIGALQKNILATESDLFIFSDAPKAGDEEAVRNVRAFLKTVKGFKTVQVIERRENNRVFNNRSGHRQLLDAYGKLIWLEEDIVTAPFFLTFINEALHFYEKDGRIFSISGYAPPLEIPDTYHQDSYLLGRFSAWGFATWKARYDKITYHLSSSEVVQNLNNPRFLKQLCKSGVDIPEMLMREVDGEIDALDIKIMYQQALHGWYTLYPKKSLVQNIGHDGSGVHCDRTSKYHHESLWDKSSGFMFNTAIEPVEEIMKANYDFRFSMNRYAIELIIENLMSEIVKNHLPSVSVWGFGELAKMLVSRLQKDQININYIVDPYHIAVESHFQGVEVITPKQVMEKSEKIFVLGMWKDLETIERKIREMSLAHNSNITVIYDKTIPANL